MSYLQDRKSKKRKYIYITFLAVAVLILFYFRSGFFGGLSYLGSGAFHPALVVGNNVGDKLDNMGSFFSFKTTLYNDNESLRAKLAEEQAKMTNYNTVLNENTQLKEILGRKSEKSNMLLAAILSKPNQSLYDTLLIDVGDQEEVRTGERVYALGDVPVGYIASTSAFSSKVILYSNPGEKTEVVISGRNVFAQITGRGGGNFEMILPRDFTLSKGDEVVLPGITPRVVAKVSTIVSDPRDAFQKALLVSPVNIFELKFVEILR